MKKKYLLLQLYEYCVWGAQKIVIQKTTILTTEISFFRVNQFLTILLRFYATENYFTQYLCFCVIPYYYITHLYICL